GTKPCPLGQCPANGLEVRLSRDQSAIRLWRRVLEFLQASLRWRRQRMRASRCVAVHGVLSAYWETGTLYRPEPDVPISRAAKTKQPFQIADVRASQLYRDGNPVVVSAVNAGVQAVLAVPMLKQNDFVGVIVIYSKEARPFTDKQIELLQNFASQ